MSILRLPVELQQEILFNLAWHEHFIAAQVCQKWASIFKTERFRRKRYVYDKIEPNVPRRGSPTNWGFQRYLPHDEGPPWRSRSGGELSLHGLMWSETLIMVLRRERGGDIKTTLLVTADAIGYLSEPRGLGLLKQFHEKRYGRRSLYDITNSPLLDSDKLYFWGKRVPKLAPIPESPLPSAEKGQGTKKVGFLESITNVLHISEADSEGESGESSGKELDEVPVISKKVPIDPPVVLFRGPVRVQQLKKEKQARYIQAPGGVSNLPSYECLHWAMVDFEETHDIGAEPIHYSGSNGDSIREFINTIKDHLIKHLFEGENSTLACWCIFDSEHRYLYDQQSGTYSHRDPRRNVWVPMTVLRNGDKQNQIDFSTRTRSSRRLSTST
ncbi:hypothetical protein TWF281_003154 [Arthrobotrys megalospora]